MAFTEKTLNEKEIFDGKIIRVHLDDVELSDGTKSFREVVEHSGGVCIAALTEDDELLMVRQYRYPFHRELLEVPAGKLEKGEDPMEAALRELSEETGITAGKIEPLGALYTTPALMDEIIYMYILSILNQAIQYKHPMSKDCCNKPTYCMCKNCF